MDREHYWLLANALATIPNTALKYDLVIQLCDLLKANNPKFDVDLFIDATEIPPSQERGNDALP